MGKRRICLVTPGHIASDPRLVKEANALHRAGFEVRVVAGDYMSAVRPLDQEILSTAPWSCVQVDLGSRLGYLKRKLQQLTAQKIASLGWVPHLSVAMWAHHPMSARLAEVAAAEPADLYIAHCLAALPAAAIAARKHHAKLGFDAEDFHIGELADTPQNATETLVRDRIERTLLPLCDHLTAASPKIAEAYAKRYGVKMEPILNVFPLSEAPVSPGRQEGDRLGPEPSLYWFSQTIGSGRGLEAIIQAMGQMHTPVRLYLRGFLAAGYAERLQQLAKEEGVGDRIHVLPPAPPTQMAQLAACHDIGLSLELTQPWNRAICLTNKIFIYLLAGIPVLVSKTPAQQEIAKYLGEAAGLIDVNNPKEIVKVLEAWVADPLKLASARAVASKLSQEYYNWDVEQKKFLMVVEKALR